MLGRSVGESIEALGFDAAAERVRGYWNAPNVVGNLECPLCDREPPAKFKADGGPNLRADPAMAAWLVQAGFTAVSLANNHAMDCGGDGLRQTLEALAKVGIGAFGAGDNLDEALRPLVISLGRRRVAMLAFGNGPAAAIDRPGVAPRTSDAVTEALRRVPAEVDATIVFLHGGLEFLEVPESWTRRLAAEAIAGGADAVVGGHPHCLRGIHTVCGKPVLYSLGDFIMDTADARHLGDHVSRTALTAMNFQIADPLICRRSLLADLSVGEGGGIDYSLRFALVGDDSLPTCPDEDALETLQHYLASLSVMIDDAPAPAAQRLAQIEAAYRRTFGGRRSLKDWIQLPFRVGARRIRSLSK
jgi:hypothetical protein